MAIRLSAIVFLVAAVANGQVMNETLELTPTGAISLDEFSTAVSLDGELAVVGSIREEGQRGAAYVFDVNTGQQLFRLAPSVIPATQRFGEPVSIRGGNVLVSASADSTTGRTFVFDALSGELRQTLAPASAPNGWLFGFGLGLSLDGDLGVVGSAFEDMFGDRAGAAYIIDVSTGAELRRLAASDAQRDDRFGWSSGLEGGHLLIGAPRDDDLGVDSGSVYSFDPATGAELSKLQALDGTAGDRFGVSIDLEGTIAAVGANEADGQSPNSGAVYIFELSTHQQLTKLVAPDSIGPSRFGTSVSISGPLLVVGDPWASERGVASGAAYVFDLDSGEFLAKLVAAERGSGDRFGETVAISGSRVVVGASGMGPSGRAFVFDLSLIDSCDGDIADDFGLLGPDGEVSFGDFLALLGLVGPCSGGLPVCTGDIADDFGTLGGDGMVSFGDFLALLGLVGACP